MNGYTILPLITGENLIHTTTDFVLHMKHIKLFYLTSCPFCKQAFLYIEKLKEQVAYKDIEIDLIEESEEPDVADQYDYFFVPSFYIDNEKLSEGIVTLEKVEEIFQKVLHTD